MRSCADHRECDPCERRFAKCFENRFAVRAIDGSGGRLGLEAFRVAFGEDRLEFGCVLAAELAFDEMACREQEGDSVVAFHALKFFEFLVALFFCRVMRVAFTESHGDGLDGEDRGDESGDRVEQPIWKCFA